MPNVDAVVLPDHLVESQLLGRLAVVIDILRATTTIVQALENGAANVIPVESVESARLLAHGNENTLLCGERGGIKPDGFILGNSPFEYTPNIVESKSCVLSTTNGTRAFHMAEQADEVLVGSLRNLGALCDWIKADGRDVTLVCSGTDRRVSFEDCLGAAMVVDRLGYHATDSAAMMFHAMNGACERFGGIRFAIESSRHAKRLIEMGFGEDVRFASELDQSSVVPRFDPAIGEIQAG